MDNKMIIKIASGITMIIIGTYKIIKAKKEMNETEKQED